jgi:two-component system sensor histidine kinase MtrB
MAEGQRFRLFGHLGLRSRIAATFAVGAVILSLVLISASLLVVRSNLLNQNETQLVERAEVNARQVGPKIGQTEVDAQTLFGSLLTEGLPSVVIRDPRGSGTYVPISADTKYGASSIPEALTGKVLDDREAAIMRYESDGEVLVAAGIPLPDDGAYFEVAQLNAIEQSLQSLRFPLIVSALLAAATGAALGWYSSRRLLRPLAEVTSVAEDVAQGHLEARVAYTEWADDPDLAPLVSSFNGMMQALQDRIDRDARFASDVSHELRSPLTTINTSVDVLGNARDDLPERAQKALDLLTEDMARFKQLVEDLLEISRFDAGAVRVELEDVDVGATVRWVVRGLSATVPVEVDPALEHEIIRCDKRRLMRIIANFIDNAAKYAGGATRIMIEHNDPADDSGEFDDGATEPKSDTIRIIVEDEGPGVPVEQRGEIFDRFNRGVQGGSRGSDFGVGLGLALAWEHARIQGGSIWVEERPDGASGARFVIELPYVEPRDVIDPDDLDEGAVDEPSGLDEVVTATGQHEAIVANAEDPTGDTP